LLIDQQKYFGFYIDDIDTAQQNPKVMAQAMEEAAYALRDEADKYVAGLFNGAGTGIGGAGGTQITTGNAYEKLVELSVALDENNVPKAGRWVIVPSWVHGKLLQDSRFVSSGSSQAEERLQNGVVGFAAGFSILTSNNVKKEVVTGTDVWRCMAGYAGAISYAEQIMSVEAFRPENRFADAVKGLHVFGAKVVRPEGLVILNAKQ
jgi:N4-gp56 family major capsid protein